MERKLYAAKQKARQFGIPVIGPYGTACSFVKVQKF